MRMVTKNKGKKEQRKNQGKGKKMKKNLLIRIFYIFAFILAD